MVAGLGVVVVVVLVVVVLLLASLGVVVDSIEVAIVLFVVVLGGSVLRSIRVVDVVLVARYDNVDTHLGHNIPTKW